MPAQHRTSVPKSKQPSTRSQQSRAASATPKSSSINDDYDATVAVNKELTAGLINQQPAKMKFPQVEEDMDERVSIQQYSQPAEELAVDPDQL
jgi:hypothetical protein